MALAALLTAFGVPDRVEGRPGLLRGAAGLYGSHRIEDCVSYPSGRLKCRKAERIWYVGNVFGRYKHATRNRNSFVPPGAKDDPLPDR